MPPRLRGGLMSMCVRVLLRRGRWMMRIVTMMGGAKVGGEV